MDAKVFCLLLLVACAYGSFLPDFSAISSAAKPFTGAIEKGEKLFASLAHPNNGKSDKSSEECGGSSEEKSGEKPKKEENEAEKLVKKFSHVFDKLFHSVSLDDPQVKNLLFSIKPLLEQFEGLLKLKDRSRRDVGDFLLGTASSALRSGDEKPKVDNKEVEKLVKELEKIANKLVGQFGWENPQAKNLAFSIKPLVDQLAGLSKAGLLKGRSRRDLSEIIGTVSSAIKPAASNKDAAQPFTDPLSSISGLKDKIPKDLTEVTETVSSLLGQNGFSELLNLVPLGSNLSSILSQVDFSKVSSVPKIPSLQDIDKLPVLPGLRENIQYARNLTKLALGGFGQTDLPTVIQQATEKAIHSLVPISALTALCSTILHIYYNIAVNSPLYVVGAAVLQDGLVTIGAVIKSVISVVADDIQKILSG